MKDCYYFTIGHILFIWYILYNICFPYFLFFIIFHLVLNADFLYIMTSFQTSSVALSFKTGSGGALLADAPHRSLPCQRNLFGFVVRAHHCNRDTVYIVGFRLRRGKVDCRRVGHIHRLYTSLSRPHFMPSFYKEIKPHLLPPLVHPPVNKIFHRPSEHLRGFSKASPLLSIVVVHRFNDCAGPECETRAQRLSHEIWHRYRSGAHFRAWFTRGWFTATVMINVRRCVRPDFVNRRQTQGKIALKTKATTMNYC